MMVTLTLLILFGAIILFFSQEFIGLFKKIFSIPGAKLLLPLAAASTLIFVLPNEFLISIYYVRLVLRQILIDLTKLMPFGQWAESIALIVLLTLGAVLPVLGLQLIWDRRSHMSYQYPYWTSAFIWVVLVLLFVIPTPV